MKNNRLKKQKIKAIFLILIYITFVTIFFCLAPKNNELNDYTTETYVVSSGETLWGIAEEYVPEGMDIREYIYELRKLNGLEDCNIHPGQEILILLERGE